MADLASLVIALDACRASRHGQPATIANGLTGDQRRFVACAQGWLALYRDERFRNSLTTHPHRPGDLRCSGIARIVDV